MKLKAYLDKKGLTFDQFGERFNPPLRAATVYRWAAGKRIPSDRFKRLIVAATNGAVKLDDLLP